MPQLLLHWTTMDPPRHVQETRGRVNQALTATPLDQDDPPALPRHTQERMRTIRGPDGYPTGRLPRVATSRPGDD